MKHTKTYNTLFLDRDGVINIQRPDDYVKSPEEFIFIEGVPEALALLSPLFKYIIVITNQRGVGKKLMKQSDLEAIHQYMQQAITTAGGRIDRIYSCTDINDHSFYRKPNTGMALQAKQDFPDIDFSTSILAGDSLSDLEFANNAGIPAVFIGNKYEEAVVSRYRIVARHPDLMSFAREILRSSFT